MKKLVRKRYVVAVVSAIAALALAGGAYAFWTTTGAGTGSASVASSNGTLVLHGVAADALTPGGSSSVSFTADNANTSSLEVGTISLDSVSLDAGHSACDVSDFSMPDVVSSTQVPAGASDYALSGSGTLSMADTALNQDACKGASLTLNLSSN
jgi:hypothetical protein